MSHWADSVVVQVAYSKGYWQRPTWQGRFAGQGPAQQLDEDGLVVAWALLERRMGNPDTHGMCSASTLGAASIYMTWDSSTSCMFAV